MFSVYFSGTFLENFILIHSRTDDLKYVIPGFWRLWKINGIFDERDVKSTEMKILSLVMNRWFGLLYKHGELYVNGLVYLIWWIMFGLLNLIYLVILTPTELTWGFFWLRSIYLKKQLQFILTSLSEVELNFFIEKKPTRNNCLHQIFQRETKNLNEIKQYTVY